MILKVPMLRPALFHSRSLLFDINISKILSRTRQCLSIQPRPINNIDAFYSYRSRDTNRSEGDGIFVNKIYCKLGYQRNARLISPL